MSSTDFDTYQAAARSTAIYPGQDSNAGLIYAALGLAGEAGEVANKVKKLLRDGVTTYSQDDLISEAGDTLWYLATLCSELGVSLADVAEGNLDKLRLREAQGTLRGSGDDR